MSRFELKLPQMGESVAEATLTSWLKEVGDTIEMDAAVFEIATDKVDSEVPSAVDGVSVEKLFNVDAIVKVGQIVAIIETASDNSESAGVDRPEVSPGHIETVEQTVNKAREVVADEVVTDYSDGERFYSPLVRNIARQEGISLADLDRISGSGSEGRVTKNDILQY